LLFLSKSGKRKKTKKYSSNLFNYNTNNLNKKNKGNNLEHQVILILRNINIKNIRYKI
jgi:hypothetical protein